MFHSTVFASQQRRPRMLMVAMLALVFMAAFAAKASATIEVQNR